MNDRTQKNDPQTSNPLAASIRLKARSMTRAYGQRRHDFRVGRQPDYVDGTRTHLNRVLMQPRPLPEIRKEIEALRKSNGARRAMKSNAPVNLSISLHIGIGGLNFQTVEKSEDKAQIRMFRDRNLNAATDPFGVFEPCGQQVDEAINSVFI